MQLLFQRRLTDSKSIFHPEKQNRSAFLLILISIFCTDNLLFGQYQQVVLGQGNSDGIVITQSNQTSQGQAINTLNFDGFLPNLNSSSRFLTQATLGHSFEDIESLTAQGLEDWIDGQLVEDVTFKLLDKVKEYHQTKKDSLNDPNTSAWERFYDNAWWQYHMTSTDELRQRIAFALSEIIVISRFSSFGDEPYALSDFYDIFLEHAFGNYRDILEEVTYHPAMAIYLTYLNNPKSDTLEGTFPDENYARELMQLFTIGLYELNLDGTIQLDGNNDPIPTYTNVEIAEFSKIFTGLSWQDRDQFFKKYPLDDTSYTLQLKMFNEYHEPGVKNLLNNFQVPDRNPVDGIADINDALDNLFDHSNVGPFISKHLIQRLVTSNPSPQYIARVATVFNDNGSGVKGDLGAVVKTILLDPEARDCSEGDNPTFGKLKEPFIRYYQIHKAFDASTLSGTYRNSMAHVQEYVEQKPHTSPSVFNFFQQDYQPIGPVDSLDLVAPEFQITNSRSITGFINGLFEWIIDDNPADEYDLFNGEHDEGYEDEITTLDFSDEELVADDAHLHILVDRLNLILAQGRLTSSSEEAIINAIKAYSQEDPEDIELRARLAIYLVMSSPEYLISR